MEEREVERLMACDFSKGTEGFAERLLEKALAELGQEVPQGWRVLEDDEIELLAAAGTPEANLVPDEDET